MKHRTGREEERFKTETHLKLNYGEEGEEEEEEEEGKENKVR